MSFQSNREKGNAMKQIKLAEYGTLTQEQFGKKVVLDRGFNINREYKLIHRTAGFQCAGSCARFDDEAWGVLFEFDGAEHGRYFKTEADARELFKAWTKQA